MKTRHHFLRSLAFSALILSSNCTTDGTPSSDDDFAAADAGNQVVEIQKDESTDSEIPNPEQVAADTAKSAEAAAGEAIDSNSGNDIQDLASEQQAGQGPQLPSEAVGDDTKEYQVANDNKAAQPVSDVEPASANTDSLPSLSQVVAESDTPAQDSGAPSKSKKSKKSKTRAPKEKPAASEEPTASYNYATASADSAAADSAAAAADTASVAADTAAAASDEAAVSKPKKAKSKGHKSHGSAGKHSASDAALSGNYYIVQPGDTLGQISTIIYGTTRRWQDLASANNLTAEAHIYPGDVLKYQADEASAEFEAKYNALPRSKIVVQKSDTLSLIAERNLGNSAFWKLLWRWNVATVAEPNKIFEGQSLEYIAPQELAALLSDRKGLKAAH